MKTILIRCHNWAHEHARLLSLLLLALSLLEVAGLAAVLLIALPDAGPAREDFAFAALVGMTYVLVAGGFGSAVQRLFGLYRPRSMKVDPLYPPKPGIFAREPEDPKALCECHCLPLADGQPIICWPQPPKFTCDTTTEVSK
ncbi:hypothetical protein QFZ75_007947 [Streptomyces sp. V3I8]|uniref:hypothetical protein n=1 Tax=Streptomyces sp. V3I8 TaxID=3042279 RepID=UPI0027831427|nr:hypothetical protein [Streptomyces sp. V3I8]MDQ1041445.1 hypothetical protein [Streptomyces sp. V3I8]